MKVKTLSALAGLGGALIMSGEASANYVNLSVSLFSTVTITGTGAGVKNVWRVYANFTNANDYLTAVAGSDLAGNMTIQQRNALDTAAGSGFYNHDFGGNTAPSSALIGAFPELAWDTFGTIGVAVNAGGADTTTLSPGFPSALLSGTGSSSNNAAWFVAGPVPQGQAQAGGPNGFRVLLAQFTVNLGENVRGTVSINGVNAGDLAAAFQSNGQTFNSAIPAPGALALLGLAGLVGSRRRRA